MRRGSPARGFWSEKAMNAGGATCPGSVAILGCARNCARYLPRSLPNVLVAARVFKDHRVILFENDSSDGTATILRRFVSQDPARRALVTERFLCARAPGRTRRLAYVRQRLQSMLAQSSFRPDVVVVMDLDDVCAHAPAAHLSRFLRLGATFGGWDAAFPRLSYDLAAWRPHPLSAYKTIEAALAASKGRPMRIGSSFNGIGLYKWGVYAAGSYQAPGQRLLGRHSRPGPCEHVTFHASLGPNVRLAMLTGCPYP